MVGFIIFLALAIAVVAIIAQKQSSDIYAGSSNSTPKKKNVPRSKSEAQKHAKLERREKKMNARMKKAHDRERQIQQFEDEINGRSTSSKEEASSSGPSARSHLNDAITRGFGHTS